MAKQVYLDYAAATPVDKKVLAAMEPYFTKNFYNPSGLYLAARRIRRALEAARADVAAVLGARPAEIVFTAGATEANNLAIQGVMRAYPGAEALVSTIEHDSVLAPVSMFDHELIPVDQKGLIDPAELQALITDRTALVSIVLVNNEIGVIQPLREISAMLAAIRQQRRANGNKLPLILHTDAAQAANYLDLHVSRLGVDMMSINGGKIYGPKQSGVLYIKAGTELTPLIAGGGQERGLRSGTENVPAAIGLAVALAEAQKRRAKESTRISALRDKLIAGVKILDESSIFNGPVKHQAPHILSVTFPGRDNERLMMELDEAGVICAVGSACSAGNDQPSHVLAAIGLSPEMARSTLRFSLGRQTVEADIVRTTAALKKILSA